MRTTDSCHPMVALCAHAIGDVAAALVPEGVHV